MAKLKTNTTYAQMGMAALVPGMKYMLELMQAQLDDFQQVLEAMQGQEPERKPLGRPPKNATNAARASGWPDDPAERSAEMRRRQAVALTKKQGPSTLSLERKAAWAKLSPRERKARLAAMKAGKAKKPPSVKLAVAS